MSIVSVNIGVVLALSFVFSSNDFQEELKKYIIGSWVEEGTTIDDKWVFSADGKCTEYSDGKVLDTYTYVLTTEKSKKWEVYI